MRAGPLSNNRVISLLNRFFVPVYAVNEDYRDGGAQPPEEKAEYNRVFKEAHAAGLSVGTVHVYVLGPDGHLIDSLHVAAASKTDPLVDVLQKAIKKLKVPGGRPLVPPKAQSAPPRSDPGSVVLHLTARSLDGRGAWGEFPAEDWIVLNAAERKELLSSDKLRTGESWEIASEISAKLLTHFYPATENNDVAKNRFEHQFLKATVVSNDGRVIRARLDGSLKMRHSFYHKEDENVVEATIVGFIEFEPTNKTIRSLHLVTDKATYGGGQFGVALRQMPRAGALTSPPFLRGRSQTVNER